jgi:dynein heavy chain
LTHFLSSFFFFFLTLVVPFFLYSPVLFKVWEAVAYPSLKPLGPWVEDLNQRLSFMQNWIDNDTPPGFWISAFFFPQAFMTGTLQNYARKHSLPIDTIEFDFKYRDDLADDGSTISERPEDGAFIYGLFLEGARWSKDTHKLADSNPKELFSSLPVLHLDPIKDREDVVVDIYRAPVYKELKRAGMLSTTGHSTNFVAWIEIPSGTDVCWRKTLVSETNAQRMYADSEKWVKAGVACFCALRY